MGCLVGRGGGGVCYECMAGLSSWLHPRWVLVASRLGTKTRSLPAITAAYMQTLATFACIGVPLKNDLPSHQALVQITGGV